MFWMEISLKQAKTNTKGSFSAGSGNKCGFLLPPSGKGQAVQERKYCTAMPG
jgi:hypothetical protein